MNPIRATTSLACEARSVLLPRSRGRRWRNLFRRHTGRVGWGVTLLLALLACGPAAQDGVTPLPLGQDVALAFGRQRLLLPIDPGQHFRVQLTPNPGDFALLVASVCTEYW